MPWEADHPNIHSELRMYYKNKQIRSITQKTSQDDKPKNSIKILFHNSVLNLTMTLLEYYSIKILHEIIYFHH
jgi:hypothetical protein